MFIVVWKFLVDPEHVEEFVMHYGPDGAWAALFRGSAAYVRTELLRDIEHPTHFLAVDYWTSKEDYARFRSECRDEYEDLDRRFARLTLREERIGEFIQGAS